MAWWRRKKESLEPPNGEGKVSVPKGLWSKCEGCGEITYTEELIQNLRVCPVCTHHHKMPTDERIAGTIDEGTWEEYAADLRSGDPLGFEDQKPYAKRVEAAMAKAGRNDAFVCGTGKIEGIPVSAGFFAFEFMGGAMTGYFVDLEHPNKMSMQWRLSSWPSGVHSSVVISFAQEEVGVTKMSFAQVGIPAG